VKQYIILATAVVFGAAACVSVGKNANAKPSTANMGQQQTVTAYYNTTCSNCHGVNGEGGGGGTRSLNTWAKFDESNDKKFFDVIKNGSEGGMEAYGAALTDAQIWAQVVHIRELQYKALRAEKGSPKAVNGVYTSKHAKFKVEEVIPQGRGLKTPWGIDWLPDGRMLVTNRPGSMLIMDKSGALASIEGMPQTIELGQGGLLDVAVHPKYAQNGWVYICYADPGPDGSALTKIARGKISFGAGAPKWNSQQTIFEAPKEFYSRAGVHFGSRIAFDKTDHVYFVVGERGVNERAQKLDNPYGKIYRLNDDGTEPKDNPYIGRTGGIKGVWTYGHRCPQGLAFDLDGNFWNTEHGPRGGDELNMVQKGGNYGWPIYVSSINYNDMPMGSPWPKNGDKINQPAHRWLPSIAASGLDVVRGPAFPGWKGDLIAGGLAGSMVERVRMKGGKKVEAEELLQGIGRVRDISTGPDGYVYIALNQPDKVIRLVPAK